MLPTASASAFWVVATFICTWRSEASAFASSTVLVSTAASSGDGAFPVRRSDGSGQKCAPRSGGARAFVVPSLTS